MAREGWRNNSLVNKKPEVLDPLRVINLVQVQKWSFTLGKATDLELDLGDRYIVPSEMEIYRP